MYPTAMTKLTIVGPKTKMKDVIESLYAQNIYHIVDHKKSDKVDIGSPMEISGEISTNLVHTRSILSYIEKKGVKPGKFDKKIVTNTIQTLVDKVQTIVDENDETNLEIEKINKTIELLLTLDDFGMQAKNIVDTKNVKFLIGKVKNSDISFDSKNISVKFSGHNVAVICTNDEFDKVISTLNLKQFIPFDTSLVTAINDSNKKAVQNARDQLEELNVALGKNNFKLSKFGEERTAELLGIEEFLTEDSAKAIAPLKFANTKDAFIVTGFVPSKKLKSVKRKLEVASDGKIYIKESKLDKTDNIPVEMKNSKIATPFEFLIHMFSLPKVNEIDPTTLMAITFPIFFGFMLGDFGYGFLLLIFFMFLKVKIPAGKALFNILMISAIGTMFFGVLFGEYFGFEEMPKSVADALGEFGLHIEPHEVGGHGAEAAHETDVLAEATATDITHADSVITDESLEPAAVEPVKLVYPTPKLIERSHQVLDLLSISIMIGIFHLLFAYLLGFINVFKDHGLWHAITEKVGWVLLIPALIWMLITIKIITGGIADILNQILPSTTVLFALAILGAIIIVIGEGFMGIIELPAILSNTLSYARLMAVGLASVQLAMIVNQFASDMFHTGGFAILGGIAILLIGHTINILLGLIGPFLHSLRLHYVEFFGKFFKGGGILFRPFGNKKQE